MLPVTVVEEALKMLTAAPQVLFVTTLFEPSMMTPNVPLEPATVAVDPGALPAA